MRKIFSLVSFFIMMLISTLTFADEKKFKISVKDAPEGSVRAFEVIRKEEFIGNIKSTTVEIMFENQTDRILEGDFEFALEEGENVVGYSLDINGKMRKGVVVEKEKARTVFESEVRKGVDPGIVEKTVGNNFKTRVYPIPARGIRKIEIVFEKETSASDDGKVFTQTIGTDTYFYFYEKINKKENTYFDKTPVSVTAFFDVSDSGKNRNIQKELDLLKSYLNVRNIENIEVVTFANTIIQSISEKNSVEGFSNIEKFIKNQKFDGATNLNIDFSKFADKSALIMLFSDGISNWGSNNNLIKKIDKKRIITINSAKSSNIAVLKKVARENRGIFVNLYNTSVNDAVSKLLEIPFRIQSVDYNSNEISDVYPIVGTNIEDGFSVAGILKKKEGKLKISVGYFGSEFVIEKTISAVDSVESEKIARLWAMKKIENLEDDKQANKKEIIETAKKFSVVTDETSLIVLDNVQQYIQHGIVPPEDLKAEYERLVTSRTSFKTNDSSFAGIPKSVLTKFEEFKKWWNKTPNDFEKEFNEKRKKIKNERSNNERSNEETETVYDDIDSESVISYEWDGIGYNPENSTGIEGQNPPIYTLSERSRSASEPMLNESKKISDNHLEVNGSKIELKAWNSNASYLSILKKTSTEKMYEKYLELKKEFGKSPAFFMEVSDYFMEENLHSESLRILSNLSEMELEDSDVLRALGNKLVERKAFALAIPIFEKLIKIRSEIPQFYRDLALSCHDAGDDEKAVENLWKIASRNWDGRFNEIQQTALNDMNSILSMMKKADAEKLIKKFNIEKKLIQNFDMDMRVILTWNTDDCDIDLWVTDPNSEKCYYGHKYTLIGGRMSRDFTDGYGPEEFCIRSAKHGSYKIEVNYYGSRQQKLLQPVTVQAEVYTNFGRKNQKKEILTLQLKDVKGTFEVGTVEF